MAGDNEPSPDPKPEKSQETPAQGTSSGQSTSAQSKSANMANVTNITNIFKQKPEPFLNKFAGLPHEKAAIHFMNWEDWLMCQLRIVSHDDFLTTFDGQMSYYLCSLVGDARLWIQGRQFLSVDDLKRQFIKRFDKEPVYEADLKFLLNSKLPHNESVSSFGEKLEQAARRINFDERALVKITFEKLPEDCRKNLHGKYFANFQELIHAAESYIGAFSSKSTEVSPPAVHFSMTEVKSEQQEGDITRLETRIQELSDQLRAYSIADLKERGRPRQKSPHPKKDSDIDPRDLPHYTGNRKRDDSRDKSERRSSSRGKSPHRSRSRGKSPHDQQQRACWNCGKPGHLYRDCRIKVENTIGRRRDLKSLRSFLAEVEGEYSYNSNQQSHAPSHPPQHHGEAYSIQRAEHRFCCCGTAECKKAKDF